MQTPASNGPKNERGPLNRIHVPATPELAESVGNPGGPSTLNVPGVMRKGPPGVVGSSIFMVPACPDVAVSETAKPALKVPEGSMVQVLLTISGSVSVPAVMITAQLLVLPVETNPPPVMLTDPQPGGP